MQSKKQAFRLHFGGRDRIRTCEAINLLVFKTSAINHSATLPREILPYLDKKHKLCYNTNNPPPNGQFVGYLLEESMKFILRWYEQQLHHLNHLGHQAVFLIFLQSHPLRRRHY